jgi:DNA-binding transcriptional ArsR family regulator
MGISDTFKVLADPLRRDILTALKEGRLTAGELSERFGVTPAALSYHLRLLKGADLVMEYRYKNFIYYELNTTVFSELIIWIKQFWGDKNEK